MINRLPDSLYYQAEGKGTGLIFSFIKGLVGCEKILDEIRATMEGVGALFV